ncbi:hypothetical protein [Kribbella sp. NPDC055071]
MKTSRKAVALVAILALAGCGNGQDNAPVAGDQKSDKSPLAEYMGDGFVSSGGGMVRATRIGGGGALSEEELAKQRKVEDATAACMKTAGFEYVAVPPESQPKSKFDDAFNLPPDKFAEQYGYGISTIDWSKAGPGSDDNDPNKKIRDALSPAAQKAYDKALNGPNAGPGGVVAIPADGAKSTDDKVDLGCRGKASEEVFGKGEDRTNTFKKFDSLFKDIEALSKSIEADQRVVDATGAWSDCLADAGHPGFKKVSDPQEQVTKKLDALTGNTPPPSGKKPGATLGGPPSFDKVDSAKLAELRKFEIALAVDDQKCKASKYDAQYKKAQYELEQEFVNQHKAELESYRDEVANK